MGEFSGSSVLITGCSSGIGRALVEEFSEKGHRVLATARNQADIEELEGPQVQTALLDVTDPQSISSAVKKLIAWTGRIDVVVNNAGYALIGPLAEVDLGDLRAQFETNVIGLIAVTQEAVPYMVRQKGGRIVNIGSVSGVTTTPFGGAYSSTKAAVHLMSDALRMELARWGIDVVEVQPGSIKSGFGDRASQGVDRYRSDSLYSDVSDQIEKRAVVSQVGAMPARIFAGLVVEAVTEARPKSVFRAGKNSLLLPFLAHLPVRIRERILCRMFGLG